MELLNALGIDWRILIAQLVNFAIFIFVLFKFAYRPIMDFLNERQRRIAKGVEDADSAKRRLIEAEVREREIVKAAKAQAAALVAAAREEAAARKDEILGRAKDEIGKLMDAEKEKLMLEKEAALREIRRDVSGLVLAALRQVLPEAAGDPRAKELVKGAVEELKRSTK